MAKSPGASRNAVLKRNHLGKDCSYLTTAASCRPHSTSLWLWLLNLQNVSWHDQKWACRKYRPFTCGAPIRHRCLLRGVGFEVALEQKSLVLGTTPHSQAPESRELGDPREGVSLPALCPSQGRSHPSPRALSQDLCSSHWNLPPLTYFGLRVHLFSWKCGPWTAAPASPEILLEMQSLGSHPTWIHIYSLTSFPSDECMRWRSTALYHAW